MNPGFPEELEREILDRHRRLYGRRSGWVGRFNPLPATPVPVLIALFLVLLGIGAGAAPAHYEMGFGMTAAIRPAEGAAGFPGVEEMLAYLKESAVAGGVSVSKSGGPGRPGEIHLLLLDARVGPVGLQRAVAARFPSLAGARWETADLRGTVRGNLAGWLGRALFRVEIDAADVETTREAILEELAARGFPPPVRVGVSEREGSRRIEVDLGEED